MAVHIATRCSKRALVAAVGESEGSAESWLWRDWMLAMVAVACVCWAGEGKGEGESESEGEEGCTGDCVGVCAGASRRALPSTAQKRFMSQSGNILPVSIPGGCPRRYVPSSYRVHVGREGKWKSDVWSRCWELSMLESCLCFARPTHQDAENLVAFLVGHAGCVVL
jgi:hypothetical protein